MRKFKIWLISFVFLWTNLVFFTGETKAETKVIVNPNQVYSYSKMISDIKRVQKTYPDIVKVKVIGKSEYGRNIYAVSLGKGSAEIFINGSHHAREWLTTNLNMYMLDQYAMAYKNNTKINGYDARKILNSTTIWFVPMVNPDGVTLQQEGLKAFPKSDHQSLIRMNDGSTNFKRWKANAKGVDLNRQYDAGWKAVKGPTRPSFKNYKGKAPATAKEVRAILSFVHSKNFEMAVAYHTSGKILYWNYKQPSANYKRDHVYAKQIGKMTGYRLVYPGRNPSGGGFTDWFIETKKRPGYTPEISNYYVETSPPLSEFAGAWRENKAVGLYLADESFKLYDTRMMTKTNAVAKELKSLRTKAHKLKTYYSTNIQKTSDLKIYKSFTTLYNQVGSETKRLEKKANALPKTYKNKLAIYFKDINNYRTHSANYFTAIKAGDSLLEKEKELNNHLLAGALGSKTKIFTQNLEKAITSTEKAISNMFGSHVKKLAKEKYTKSAKVLENYSSLVVSRYTLTVETEKELKAENIETVKANLEKLEKWKQDAATKYPVQVKKYKKSEDFLETKINKIKEKLEELEEEEEEEENSEPVEETSTVDTDNNIEGTEQQIQDTVENDVQE